MKLLIRADGNSRIGTGHLMRCLSLAQGCRGSGGDALFVSGEITPSLEQRLRATNFDLARLSCTIGSDADAEQTIRLAREYKTDWIVLDGYHFGSEYQR